MLFFIYFVIINIVKGDFMQRYFAKEKQNDSFILFESDLHHIKNVMRNEIGDKIEIVYEERVFICEINSLNPLLLKVIEENTNNSESKNNLTIAISLVNEQKMDLILQKLTELGVTKIIPMITSRSIVKLDSKKAEKKIARWQMICKEASEQSKRLIIPKVTNIITLKELSKETATLNLICSTSASSKSLTKYLNNNKIDILFAIGPEGGFAPEEEKFLINCGFMPVSLGKRILRVETAAIYVASIINYIYEG